MARFSKRLCNAVLSSVAKQDDPKERVVTNIVINTSDPLWDTVTITTSTPDGWAEKTFSKSTYMKSKWEVENGEIGSTEEEALQHYITSELSEVMCILDRYFENTNDKDLEDAAEAMCCGYMITSGGACNWENIYKLRKCGYAVYPGDKDSFGWLTGVVTKGGKKLVFG